jgi:hypothetical protein
VKARPDYFAGVREKAASRWVQLEGDPDLAGPWHQLFKQVQSPRHVLSELLQNADDAGATEASVRTEGEVLIFEHNGEDFSEEHFASLCRFGYSNKRALHTIGFRGIGFKSCFSLGDRVELETPTLSVFFDRLRFTEPRWNDSAGSAENLTRIRVAIKDSLRQQEVERNLNEWLTSPTSLLFFRSLRKLSISGRAVHWGSMGPGPIADSEWMALHGNQDEAFLIIRSSENAFPNDALAEIRQERMLGSFDEADFPPCKVEIVLGAKGRLYVVLPTGVETNLPFACNAPFVQDPARLKIKDPETSPTNRWLLQRAGELAGSAMLEWLSRESETLGERAKAYDLLPERDRSRDTLEGACGATVADAFERAIAGGEVLLTEGGDLAPCLGSVAIPQQILEVWPEDQAAALLDGAKRPALCRHVQPAHLKNLLTWRLVNEIDRQALLRLLRITHLPRPETWRQLMCLWAYVAPEITGYRSYMNGDDLKIVPAQGKDVLYAASEVVRLGEKKLLTSEADWEFLSSYLIVLNSNWTRFLTEQRRVLAEQSPMHERTVAAAIAVLKAIGLENTSNIDEIIDQVAAEFFSGQNLGLEGIVQLAQIAAKLGASAGDEFRFASRDRKLRSLGAGVFADTDSKLEELVPEAWRETRLLHPAYGENFTSCSRDEWAQWIASGKSGLSTMLPLKEAVALSGNRKQLDEYLKVRGFVGAVETRYKNPWFRAYDWDFEPTVWAHWHRMAQQKPTLWGTLGQLLLAESPEYWTQKTSARVVEEASNGHERTLTRRNVTPGWIVKLRGLPCIPDTRGVYRKPSDLARRTPETEMMIGVEHFVHGLLDIENNRQLLDLLGVRSKPAGPSLLLDRLRTLALATDPPIEEVGKWYRRLDAMMDNCSTADFAKVKSAFQLERLILSDENQWTTASTVFLNSDETGLPGASLVLRSVADLTLWRKVGVSDRPSAELAIAWLRSLPTGQTLLSEDARRARTILVRYPVRAWAECDHWLNLAGEWVPTVALQYALTMQSLVPWSHLHAWVKRKTADFQRLASDVNSNPPFSGIALLSDCIEDRVQQGSFPTGPSGTKDWLRVLGTELCRVAFDSDDETQRVRALAGRLAETVWQETGGVHIIPYIEGKPAGTERASDVIWRDGILYVESMARGRLARRVPEEIGRAFVRADIKAALDYGFERPASDVREYLSENFTLVGTTDEVAKAGADEGVESSSQSQHAAASAELPKEDDREDDSEVSTEEFEEGEGTIEGHLDGIELDTLDTTRPARRAVARPAKPTVIERFANLHGFRRDGDERFLHADGSSIARTNDSPFPWERRDISGGLVQSYLPVNKCLQREPVEIGADAWALIDGSPDGYALIVPDPNDSVAALTGRALCQMRDAETLILYPATYRLVHASGD